MSSFKKRRGASLAMAVAITFATISYTPAFADNNDIVMCPGVNNCRGMTDCAMSTDTCSYINRCKGQNECKGKGFLMLSKKECVARGSRGIIRKLAPNHVHSQPIEETQ